MADEKEEFKLPVPPWTVEELGEKLYGQLAIRFGFFNPAQERPDYRPALDCGPYLDQIRADNADKKQATGKGKKDDAQPVQ